MKAVRIHDYGGSDKLVFEEVPRPALAEGKVLVRIRDAGVNPYDWKLREGHMKWGTTKLNFPLTLGNDFAGVIEEVGPGIQEFKAGDEVFGFAEGSYAEFAAVPVNDIALKPSGIDFATAASIPTAGLTAWQLFVDTANVKPGQRVLIHGAAGGVGSFAVQLAKWREAEVIGTAATEDAHYLREIGIDDVIDYKSQKFEERVANVDVVIDLVGGAVLGRSYPVMRKKGSLIISTVGYPDMNALGRIGGHGVRFLMKKNSNELGQLAALIEKGIVKPRLAEVLPLEDAPKAQDILQKGHAHGKIVLEVKT